MRDSDALERIRLEAKSKRRALAILGVREGASPEEIKAAWRRACREMHPDRHGGGEEAHRRFILLHSAYRFLIDNVLCNALRDDALRGKRATTSAKYDRDNSWGMFLWWRERFF